MSSSPIPLLARPLRLATALALSLAASGAGAQSARGGWSGAAASTSAGSRDGANPAHDGEEGEDEPTLRARSERGLAISPAPIDTSSMSAHQRRLVGLGSYIVNAASDCAGCHSSAAGFLAGGNPFNLDASGHTVWSRNLTPDAMTGLQLTREQFVEAIRTGRDFHPGSAGMLVVMPWMYLRWASDLDLDAVYAYLRAIPPVTNSIPPDTKSGLGLPPAIPFPGLYTDGVEDRKLRGAHRSFDARRGLSISPLAEPAGLDREAREDFGVGSYVANALTACSECHTNPERTQGAAKINTPDFLTGGTVFAVPPPLRPQLKQVRSMSANLKGASFGFLEEPGDSYQRFHDLITTGTHVDENPPRPLGFPMILIASYLRNLLDEDLRAVYGYVKALPATTGPSDVERQPYARWCATASDCRSGETCSAATSECVGGACTSDVDCGACQTCGGATCQAPASDSACVAGAR